MLFLIGAVAILGVVSTILILAIYKVRSSVAIPRGPYLWISNLCTFTLFFCVPTGLLVALNANSKRIIPGTIRCVVGII